MNRFFASSLVAAFGLVLGWTHVLADAGAAWRWAYLGLLGFLTAGAVLTGVWWFVRGEGERRLRNVLEGFAAG